ncbi:MAG: hypothetical protein ACE5PO_00400 [Candidatus Bathyarchaeia archaeon]
MAPSSTWMLNGGILQRIRRQAMRRRVWFRTLQPKERALVNATILCRAKVRSPLLTALLQRIVGTKLVRALRSSTTARVWTTGWKLARRVSQVAVAWGYEAASQWEHDPYFAKFLAINHCTR